MAAQNGGTFSRTPFIGKDGPDANGVRAEVKVITGLGNIHETKKSARGNSVNVLFRVDNTPHNPSGWVPADSPVLELVRRAEASGEPIEFRLENRRKDTVDRTLPFSVISPPKDMNAAKENIYKSLAAVRFPDDENWTISKVALTRMEEDPVVGGLHSAYAHTMDELNQAKAAQTPAATGGGGSLTQGNSPEGKRWLLHNPDGSTNPGADAVGVPVTLYGFVTEWERDHDGVTFTEAQRLELARLLLSIANRAQVAIYADREEKLTKADLTLTSHIRARALIFEVIRSISPLTTEVGSDPNVRQEWAKQVFTKVLGMWRWSMAEVDPRG